MEDVYIIYSSIYLAEFTIKNKNFMNVYLLFVILKCSNLFLVIVSELDECLKFTAFRGSYFV